MKDWQPKENVVKNTESLGTSSKYANSHVVPSFWLVITMQKFPQEVLSKQLRCWLIPTQTGEIDLIRFDSIQFSSVELNSIQPNSAQ